MNQAQDALSLVGMLCRGSERAPEGPQGTEALVRELATRRDATPRLIGTPSPVRTVPWTEDLASSRGCLLEAGGQVDDALASGRYPLLVAADCSVSLTTLPAAVRHRSDVTVLWLDAHGDFNTPSTSPSGYLGGMCLAGACGVWDPGLGQPPVDPGQVLMCGIRDLDAGELALLDLRGVTRVTRPSQLADAVAGRALFVHLDLDVLDPSVLPAPFPVSGGLSDAGLRTLLDEVAEAATLVGAEVTGFATPELVELIATVVDPLVP